MKSNDSKQPTAGAMRAPKWKRAMHATGIELCKNRGDGFDESFATLKNCTWETAGEIIRAVNSHAELAEMLTALVERLEPQSPGSGENGMLFADARAVLARHASAGK